MYVQQILNADQPRTYTSMYYMYLRVRATEARIVAKLYDVVAAAIESANEKNS